MSDRVLPYEAEIILELPAAMSEILGRIITVHSVLEHKLTSLSVILLQLNKGEARIAVREPKTVDRLDMALDLFAIKDIEVQSDTQAIREAVGKATAERNKIAHGLWLKHPGTGQVYLRIARGQWSKDLTRGERVSRAIYPQSVPFGVKDCKAILEQVLHALKLVDELGKEIDIALQSSPEKFQPPSPLLNPLGVRNPKGKKPQRGS